MLEACLHQSCCFVTLTYSPEHLPSDGSLSSEAVQLWLKRLRKAIHPIKVRYFLVGEYGDDSFRPHYHAAMFGIGREFQEIMTQTWGLGFVHVGDLTMSSASYIAGYVTKKMTAKDDERLNGRYPEFARMSRDPGIGVGAMVDVARSLNDQEGMKLIARDGDVPISLKTGRKSLPLGRTLRSKLREEMGFATSGGQSKPEALRKAELQALRDGCSSDAHYAASKPFIDYERIKQLQTRAKIWSKKGSI